MHNGWLHKKLPITEDFLSSHIPMYIAGDLSKKTRINTTIICTVMCACRF
jgi:hypothetical protein